MLILKGFLLYLSSFCLGQAQPRTSVSQPSLPGGADKRELVGSNKGEGGDAEVEAKRKSQNGPSGRILSSHWRENATVTNDFLRLAAWKAKRGGQEWTAGSIWTREMCQFGCFEHRCRYPAADGLNSSFWLMSTDMDSVRIYRKRP